MCKAIVVIRAVSPLTTDSRKVNKLKAIVQKIKVSQKAKEKKSLSN